MRAFIVAVNYNDLLSITLPYNRHHFTEVNLITDLKGVESLSPIAKQYDCQLLATDVFYENGAVFNKWVALEKFLSIQGRHGWIVLMDADILWPKEIPAYDLICGNLYTPRRRIWPDVTVPHPSEMFWSTLHRHRNEEFAGWTQIFHGDDPHLGNPPWHEINWKHAGGADSFFQRKWPAEHKLRPPFECLHLGPTGQNWCGRASQMVDGTIPDESQERISKLRDFMNQRAGKRDEAVRFAHEKLS